MIPGRRTGLVLFAAGLLTAACDEVRQAPPPPPPAGLGVGGPEPMLTVLDRAAADFADRGAALEGRPIETADAVARLEYLSQNLAREQRFASLAGGVGRELILARQEVRNALGIAQGADPTIVSRAMLSIAARLRAGDQAAAERLMTPPLFQPGGARSLARLSEPGPLPQAMVATGAALEAARRLDANPAGASRLATGSGIGMGSVTTNFTSETSTGY